MSPLKKYTFVPEHQLKEAAPEHSFSVSINKIGSIYISSFDVKMYELENKVIRLYVDIQSKTISWKEIKEGSLEDIKGVRKLVPNPTSGAVLISIGKLLSHLGISKESLPIKNIPVTMYKDTLIDQPFNVIDLKNKTKSHA